MEKISFDDFTKVELRTARVLEAVPHPDADRLYLLQLEGGPAPSQDDSESEGASEPGPERRQIVAGVRDHYSPEDLVGRTIVVVWNLKPAVIRGQESQGMLLAVSDGDTVSILGPDKPISPGCRVS
jgi:tRNA-binding EMAP/Myf-like protein